MKTVAASPSVALPRVHPGFREAPPLRVYLHHAYTTALLATRPEWKGALLNHYIQVQLAADEYGHEGESFDYYPFVDHRMLADLGVFTLRRWELTDIVGRPEADLMAALRDRLDGERCIEVYLDEYFVPTSWAFRRRHFRHQHLLVGHDGDRFIGVGYGADGRFGYTQLPPPLLYRGLLSRDRSQDNYASKPAIVEIERRADYREAPDRERICRQLEDFIEARNHYRSYSDYPFARDIPGARFGVAAYGEVFGRLREAFAEQRPCDARYGRLAFERADLMARRLTTLAGDRPGVAARRLLSDWTRLVARWRAFHLSTFEHNLRLAQGQRGGSEEAVTAFEDNTYREVDLTRRTLTWLN